MLLIRNVNAGYTGHYTTPLRVLKKKIALFEKPVRILRREIYYNRNLKKIGNLFQVSNLLNLGVVYALVQHRLRVLHRDV
jgi:protein-arginine kinase